MTAASAISPIRLFQGAATPDAQRAATAVLESGQIASGPLVREFEQALQRLLGRGHVVTTNDMTSAMELALQLAGVSEGDQVATLAFNCLSSNAAIANVGARPLWVDIDPRSATMSINDLKSSLTAAVKAVVMYHVAGYPGPAREVAALCRERGIPFIEDCNNALGAERAHQAVGLTGDFAVFSFYPNRQINAGEGGALLCPDEATAARAMRLRRFGIDATTFRDPLGEINSRSDIAEIGRAASLSQLNAAIGLAHIPLVAERRSITRRNAQRLSAALRPIDGITVVDVAANSEPTYWGLLVLSKARDVLLRELKTRGVQASKLHQRNDLYSGFNVAARPLPGTDCFSDQALALPCGWWLTDEEMSRLIELVQLSAEAAARTA